MRWTWLAPFGLLALLAAYFGLREGRAVADLDETAVISAFAARYARDVPGGQETDCAGRPGTGRVWLIVECTPTPHDAVRHRRYLVGRGGQLVDPPGTI